MNIDIEDFVKDSTVVHEVGDGYSYIVDYKGRRFLVDADCESDAKENAFITLMNDNKR